MKCAKCTISSSFYISFSIYPFFPFTFHTLCISDTYGEPTPFLLSRSFHTIRFVIQSEAKDLGNTNLSIIHPFFKIPPSKFQNVCIHF